MYIDLDHHHQTWLKFSFQDLSKCVKTMNIYLDGKLFKEGVLLEKATGSMIYDYRQKIPMSGE